MGGNGLILTTEGPREHETIVIIGNEFEIRLMITLLYYKPVIPSFAGECEARGELSSDRAGRRAAVRLP